MSDWLATLADFEGGLAATPEPFFAGLAHGTMTVELFRPEGEDTQQPHAQDELYIIRRGRSEFLRGGERVSVGEGDSLFVPAGMDHRFVDFSDDFDTWVVFWGPEGGE
ncbi:cupin domain-containing protein [Paraurantiacibacter namhicola]|uniref:Cupin domain protein n=1 Tax=Paraurantiacibacter namhicola TaxID=645517 RepID=A0A1C7D768_9SPHN|nr:cupin domain-containing protein [Paraurantiacibacter namhicola]ANU07298.1 Cupin domain protein [Paraurantiacibacter namhicola]